MKIYFWLISFVVGCVIVSSALGEIEGWTIESECTLATPTQGDIRCRPVACRQFGSDGEWLSVDPVGYNICTWNGNPTNECRMLMNPKQLCAYETMFDTDDCQWEPISPPEEVWTVSCNNKGMILGPSP